MMDLQPKVPPRYVPTLTEVVQEPSSTPSEPAQAQVPASPESAAPPRPVEAEVHSAAAAAGFAPRFAPAGTAWAGFAEPDHDHDHDHDHALSPRAARDPEVWMQAEERLVQRLLERVERVLDQRLRESIAQVVQEQTRSVTLRLQEELESVVRQTVQDAIAQEREAEGQAVSAPPARAFSAPPTGSRD